jgi:short-subunit dehydrogenase
MTVRRLAIISGSSGGFGRAITLALSQSEKPLFPIAETKYVLLSRNVEGMQETKSKLLEQCGKGYEDNVSIVRVDYSQIENMKNTISQLLEQERQKQYEHVILIHNAGTLGALKYVHELANSTDLVQEHMTVNITSCYVLNSLFLASFLVSYRRSRI